MDGQLSHRQRRRQIARAAILAILLVACPAAAQDAATQTATAEATATAPGEPVRVAHMRLAGNVLESPPGFALWPEPEKSHTLRTWLHRLAEARQDDGVDAVALEVDSPSMSWAQAQELADAIRRLDKVKPVHCYLPGGWTAPYMVASAGSEVAMHPVGGLIVTGVGAEVFFYRGTLDLLGIEPQFIQAGRFKGAAEPLTQTEPTDEMQRVLNWILDDLYAQLCEQIARQRGLEPRQVRQVIDRGPFTAPEAQRYRLVDALVERIRWQQHVASELGATPDNVQWLENYAAPSEPALDFSNPFALLRVLMEGPEEEKIREPTIAVIHADGMIVSGRSGDGLFGQSMVGSRTLVDCFEQVRTDDRIKAVVFRINSPGGSALASERIYQAARRCAEDKPVIASIGGTGASGGYYIALGADEIVADPAGIVGSIGVVGGKLAMTGLLDKLGISSTQFTRGENAGMWTSRAWTPREMERVRQMIRRTYNVFVRRVTEQRQDKVEDIDAVAQGRIFTARQAVDNGLIDQVGGMREAVIAAQEAAGIEKSYFITLPKPKTLLDLMQGGGATAPPTPDAFRPGWLAPVRSPAAAYLLNLALQLDRECVLTALPYYLETSP
jgi:protease-4